MCIFCYFYTHTFDAIVSYSFTPNSKDKQSPFAFLDAISTLCPLLLLRLDSKILCISIAQLIDKSEIQIHDTNYYNVTH